MDISQKNIDEINEILEKYFKKHPEIELAYIFGSIPQGRANPLSDIDIALNIDHQQVNESLYRYGYKAEILADLIKLLKTNNIDIVILNEANPLLKHKVLYSGKLIYSKNEKKRIQFQVDAISKYNDYKYIAKTHLKEGLL